MVDITQLKKPINFLHSFYYLFYQPITFVIIIRLNQYPIIHSQMSTLPLTVSDQDQDLFCYSVIKTIPQSIIGFALMPLALLLLIKAIVQYRRAGKINMLGGSVKYIYICTFLWAIVYLLKMIEAQLIYWIQILRPEDNTPEIERRYSQASKYLFCNDVFSVFLVQALLILICYNWMSNVIVILEQLIQMDNDEKVAQTAKSYLKFQKICKKILKFYLYFRFLYVGIGFAFIFVTNHGVGTSLLLTMFVLLQFEALAVLIILGLSIHAIRKNDKLANLVNQDQIKDMLKKYIILFFCSLARFFVVSIIVYSYFYNLSDNSKVTCYATKDEKTNSFIIVFMLLQGIFSHSLPVFVVLRIYRVQTQDIELTQSLLQAEQLTSSNNNSTHVEK